MATIQELFDKYNRQYFGGKLEYHVVDADHAEYMDDDIVASRLDGDGVFTVDGYCCHGRQIIFINPHLNEPQNRRLRRHVLLHEMAHAATGEGHTEKWLQEMDRLEQLGALRIDEIDRESVLDDADSISQWKQAVQKYQLTSHEKVEELLERLNDVDSADWDTISDDIPMFNIPECCDFCRDDFYRHIGVLPHEPPQRDKVESCLR